MARKCFISYKQEDQVYKKIIQNELDVDMIDNSLNIPIPSYDDEYIMRVIRERHLSNSTVTIYLIGAHSGENRGAHEQRFIKRELQASLYDATDNRRNGILGVVLPDMYDSIYRGSYPCSRCLGTHNHVIVEDHTIKEFSYNYYLPTSKCAWTDEDRYCVLVKWEKFVQSPEIYIEKAFDKRSKDISSAVRVYPK